MVAIESDPSGLVIAFQLTPPVEVSQVALPSALDVKTFPTLGLPPYSYLPFTSRVL